MKRQYIGLVSFLISGLLSAETLNLSSVDHLIPPDPKLQKYRELLASKLGATPFDCGRAILAPSTDPEAGTSIYAVQTKEGRIYRVTNIRAKQNLWQITDSVRYPAKAKSVLIERIDAELPEHTALLVREAWLRMLQGPDGPRPIARSKGVVSVDVSYAEFSIQRASGAPLVGTLEFGESFPSTKTKQLVDIWNELYEYCKASVEKRPEIAAQIEREASLLIGHHKRVD